MKEYWDLYDKNRKPLNRTHERGLPLPKGAYHVVVAIWTINSKGEILLTQRDKSKPYPLKWESTAGSVLAGETSVAGAVRELFEETGIVTEGEKLTLILTHISGDSFWDTYILHHDAEINDLKMQPGETVAAKWVTVDEVRKLIATGELPAPIKKRFQQTEHDLLLHTNGGNK